MVKAALIGCGVVSIVHFEAIEDIDGSELVAVCDIDPEVARATGERWGVPSFTDPLEMIQTVGPDVVHISTPHDQHVDVAITCLEAGVAVLCEKPVAATVAEANRLVQWSAEHPEATVGICLQNRYNATSQAARRLLESGELGEVRGAFASVAWHRNAAYYAQQPWRGQRARAGGGTLINQSIHTVDLLQWLLGEVTEVRGRSGTYLLEDVIDVEDSAQLILDHATGVRSLCFATNTSPVDFPIGIDIATEKAQLSIRGGLTVTYVDGQTVVIPERLAPTGGKVYWGVSHRLLIEDFHAHVSAKKPFWIDPAEGVKSLAIIDQVYELSR